MNTLKIPSVLLALKKYNTNYVQGFTIPEVGENIGDLLSDLTINRSPTPKVIGLKWLRLRHREVIPAHRNPKKEKLFFLDGEGYVSIYIFIDGQFVEYILDRNNRFVIIPRDTVHAVHGFVDYGHSNVTLKVITSCNENDVLWEEKAETLTKERPWKKT